MTIYPHWHVTVYWGGQYSNQQIYHGETLRVRPGTSNMERHYEFCDDENCWFSKFPKAKKEN